MVGSCFNRQIRNQRSRKPPRNKNQLEIWGSTSWVPPHTRFLRRTCHIGFTWICSDNWAIILIRSDFSFSESIFFHFYGWKGTWNFSLDFWRILENDINGIIERWQRNILNGWLNFSNWIVLVLWFDGFSGGESYDYEIKNCDDVKEYENEKCSKLNAC